MAGHEFVVDAGRRMHVLTAGSPTDTLYLHGVGGSAWTFEATLRAMPDAGSWACVDLLGYGSSSWLPDGDYSTLRQVQMLRRVLDAVASDSVSVVGFSWGGLIGLELARQDARVSKLALVDIAPTTDASPEDVPTMPATYLSMEAARDAVLRLAPRASSEIASRDALLSTRPIADGFEKQIDPVLLRRWQFRAEDHWDALAEVRQEILLVRAALSPVLSADTAAEMLTVARRADLVEIPGSGHLIPLERPELLAKTLRGFLHAPRTEK